jgi:hypothetical protein
MPDTTGSKTGSFIIPTSGETSANVWYRVYLTVTDSGGMTHTSFRDVTPRTTTVTLDTVRSGLQVTLDGQPHTAPYSVLSVEGITRTIGTSSPQTLTSTPWTFVSWSDAGAVSHTITTPVSDTTYTATFRPEIGVPPNETITPLSGPSGSTGRIVPSVDASADVAAGAAEQRDQTAAVLLRVRMSKLLEDWHGVRTEHAHRFWWDRTPSAAISRWLRTVRR